MRMRRHIVLCAHEYTRTTYACTQGVLIQAHACSVWYLQFICTYTCARTRAHVQGSCVHDYVNMFKCLPIIVYVALALAHDEQVDL